MRSYREHIKAGEPLNQNISGTMLFITACTAGPVLTVELIRRKAENGIVSNVGKGLQVKPVGGFDALKIISPVDATVDFVVTDGSFDLAFNEDAATIGNGDANPVPIRMPAGQRLPVDLEAGTVNVNAVNVGINNNDAAALPVRHQALTNFVHRAAVAVGLAATSLGASDATLRKLIFRNDHAAAKIALGGAGVTLANAPIVLLPGDIWKEEDAAGAEWFAISDVAAANIQIMGLK